MAPHDIYYSWGTCATVFRSQTRQKQLGPVSPSGHGVAGPESRMWGRVGRIERASCFTGGPDQLRREGTLEGTQKGNQSKDKEQEPTVTSTGSASSGARSLKGSRGSTRRTSKQATPGLSLLSSVSSPSRISDKRLPQQRKQYHHDWR